MRKATFAPAISALLALVCVGSPFYQTRAQDAVRVVNMQSGPTPYPSNAKAWPGAGAIRVFPFMNQNRAGFWQARSKNHGAVVFVGDSLIGGWKTLPADFPSLHVANLSIGGEPSRGLLFRLKEDVIDLAPRAVVVLTGPNDMSADESLAMLEANLREIVKQLRASASKLPIIICNLPPRDSTVAPVDPKLILSYNKVLSKMFHDDEKIKIVDLHTVLATPDGAFDPENFGKDRLHISPHGYDKFRAVLSPALTAMEIN